MGTCGVLIKPTWTVMINIGMLCFQMHSYLQAHAQLEDLVDSTIVEVAYVAESPHRRAATSHPSCADQQVLQQVAMPKQRCVLN